MALRVPSLRSLQSNRGFALLITLTMLAFIVLMLVGLAAYTKVETSVAGNTQRQAQARENALLALNVAVGQLQKYAGVDTAITATADGFGGRDGTRHYTGVWPSTYVPPAIPEDPEAPAVTPTPEIPRTWLVSGNEFTKPDATEGAEPGATVPAPLEITPSAPGARLQVLVGSRSTATNNTRNDRWVEAPLVDLTATGVPGTSATASTVIGRYAWWVGDQGVKAPVAVPIPENSVSHQFAQGGPGTGADGAVVFDPWSGANSNLVDGGSIGTFSQLAFLRSDAATQLVGPASLRQNYHAWTTNNYAVLADTKRGGLRQDLSLDPSLLGDAFKAWSNYLDYMEPPQPPQPPDPSAPAPTTPVYTGPSIFPEYIEGITLRRRYWMVPQQAADGVAHSVAPVLNFFGLTISVHEDPNNAGEIEVSARCGVGLWNPYTSALLPEDLKIEIEGLPEIEVFHSRSPLSVRLRTMPLLSNGTGVLTFRLPWVNAQGVPDTHSWLPGRVYNWASVGNSSLPTTGNEMSFHQPDLTSMSGTFDITRVPGIRFIIDPTRTELPTRWCSLIRPDPVVLTVRVRRASDDALLGEYTSPPFYFPTPSNPLDFADKSVDFGFVFRLPDLNDGLVAGTPAQWLTTQGVDPRETIFPSSGFTYGAQGSSATLYGGLTVYGFNAASSGRLLEREATAQTFDTDAPVFELPRTVFLSVGGLQHLHLPGARPFAIGNPWGSNSLIKGMTANSLFDRYFFSGLTDKVEPATTDRGDILLPNFLLKPLRKPDHSKVTADDMRLTYSVPNTTDPTLPNEPSPVASRSSKFFLQSAAFNLNSTSAAAWASVLSAMRIPGGRGLNYLNASEATGTAADSETQLLVSSAPHYFRFAQSAAETFKAEDPAYVRTSYFRKGVRSLTPDQVGALATAIANRIRDKHNAVDGTGGPFRSIEEFLTPFGAGLDVDGNDIPATTVLDAAIAAAGINLGVPEFSSQWLTQADIMSALAPTLFPRSDTFVVRTYGEALNPATGLVEGRAWCEAIVQRLPEYFADPATYPPESLVGAFEPVPNPDTPEVEPEPTEAQKLNKALGRRFKVVSFRWLTRADI